MQINPMFKTITFLIFLNISQAPIFAQVKSIDFAKKNQMVYSRDTDSSGFKTYIGKKIELKKLTLNKKEFDNHVGKQLIDKRPSLKGTLDLESHHSLGLINKYQFRQDLNEKPKVPIARVGGV